MSATFEQFKKSVAKAKTDAAILNYYTSLWFNDTPILRQKRVWMEEEYGSLCTGNSLDITQGEKKEEDPYQVRLARKYQNLYKSAKLRGKEFTLNLYDMHLLLRCNTCYYTGKTFVSGDKNLKRTIERVDPDKGYVRGNVVAVTHEANYFKARSLERTMRTDEISILEASKMSQAITEKVIQRWAESQGDQDV